MGNGSMLMAAIRNELPYMVKEDLEYFFRENIISS